MPFDHAIAGADAWPISLSMHAPQEHHGGDVHLQSHLIGIRSFQARVLRSGAPEDTSPLWISQPQSALVWVWAFLGAASGVISG